MCGRVRCTLRRGDIPRACHLNDDVSVREIDLDRYRPSYNVSPGSHVPVARREDGEGNGNGNGVVLQCMKWGLIPSFTKKDEKPDHYKMFNARGESITEKPDHYKMFNARGESISEKPDHYKMFNARGESITEKPDHYKMFDALGESITDKPDHYKMFNARGESITEKPDHYKMFNARGESITEKASFRRLVPKNRCLVAVEGFYEWKKDGSKKQPYYIHLKDGRPLVFAALYDSWKSPEGETLFTFTIITTSSSKALQWLHDRMPVILGDEASTGSWLNGSSSSKLDTLLKPYEDSDLGWYPVTPAMGKPSFDSPECINEIPLKTEARSITSFFSKKAPTAVAKQDPEDSKPKPADFTAQPPEPGPTNTVKRELGEPQAGPDPTRPEPNEPIASPVKKKSKPDPENAASGKQSTLLSFVGKG